MDDPAYDAVLKKLDQENYYMSSRAYTDFVKREVGEQEQVMKQLGLKVE